MSKTFKHQRKYDAKRYWQEHRGSWGTHWVYDENGDLLGYARTAPEPKDISEPDFRYTGMNIEVRRKQWIERDLQKKFRRKVKRLIHQGEYDLLPLKPQDSAWIIW